MVLQPEVDNLPSSRPSLKDKLSSLFQTNIKKESAVYVILATILASFFVIYANTQTLLNRNQTLPITTSSSSAQPNQADQTIPPKPLTEAEIQANYTKANKDNTSPYLIKSDLELESDPGRDECSGPSYYQVGTFPTGKYQGYKRIIMANYSCTGGSSYFVLFATKDDKNYVLHIDDPQALLVKDTSLSPLSGLDTKKVTATDDLVSATFPRTIKLNSSETLLRYQIYQSDNYFYESDYKGYSTLPAVQTGLSFYARPRGKITSSGPPAPGTNRETTEATYISSTTEVDIGDSTSFAYEYIPTSLTAATKYLDDLINSYTTSEPGSNYISPPNGFSFKSATGSFSTAVYDDYERSFPRVCAHTPFNYATRSVTDADLVKIGTANGADWYTLSDKNHPLNKLAYEVKIVPGSDFTGLNPGKTSPTYDQYVTKNPLIFTKDYWGRWIMLGEYDYNIIGGCGKPVVYLYPTKLTEVKVSFGKPMKFDVSIPIYRSGWDVLANPDGTLRDLQPQFTNCAALDSSRFGSEYAASSCQSNSYPYLYWAGSVTDSSYPSLNKGWVVTKDSLSKFLDSKLTEIGLSTQERTDMLSYWVPVLTGKNSPYYRLTFFQNRELGQMIPMNILPRPDSLIRVFLDWEPLNSPVSIASQSLIHYDRRGFTAVEWGGLKR